MATIHQRRQPPSSQHSETDPDSDWHLVASTSSTSHKPASLPLRRHSSALSSSALEFSSDALLTTTETDDDEPLHLSDPEPIATVTGPAFTVLPSHDGEGNFGAPASTDDDDLVPVVLPRRTRSRIQLSTESSDSSLPNLLLPGGGLPPPRFARATSGPGQPLHLNLGRRHVEPQFRPTIPPHRTVTTTTAPITTSMATRDARPHHPSEVLGEHGYSDLSPGTGGQDLELNPMHHPTLLTTLWQHLSRLAADLLDAEHGVGGVRPFGTFSMPTTTGTVDRMMALAGEAREEGMLPFGSHLTGHGFTRRRSIDDSGAEWRGVALRKCQSEIGFEWEKERKRRGREMVV